MRAATILSAAALVVALVTLVLVVDLKEQVVDLLVRLEFKVDGKIVPDSR